MTSVACSTGLDRITTDVPAHLRGARVGLIANPASVDACLVHALDRIANCPDLQLIAAFGPQHGARGDMQDNMIESDDAFDSRLDIPVFSLYGQHRKPTPEMLADVDALLCDLPDVGCRPYTFLSTMVLSMQACAENGKRFVVLDRPNPIGGIELEGNVLDPRFRSFIGLYPLPMRHGMTMGELAALLNTEYSIGAELEIIRMSGWQRELYQDHTDFPWVLPSPNMPTIDTAIVYPGTVLIEGTNLSEGRGTTRPFETIGAPFLDADSFAARLNGFDLPGVRFRPTWFRPTFEKWCGQLCGGIQMHVTDRLAFRPFFTGLAIIKTAMELAPDAFAWRQPPFEYEWEKLPIDILCGTDAIRTGLEEQEDIAALEAAWQADLEAFAKVRERYLLY